MIYTKNRCTAYRIAAAVLALCCAIFICTEPIKVQALLSEAIFAGTVIAAFLAACGLVFDNTGVSSQDALEAIYDRFVDWNETEDALQLILQAELYRGKLKIDNALSNLLSEFALQLNNDEIYTQKSGIVKTSFGPQEKFFYNYNNAQIPKDKILPFDTAVQVLLNDNLYHTFVVKADTSRNFEVYKDGSLYYSGGSYARTDNIIDGWAFGYSWYPNQTGIIHQEYDNLYGKYGQGYMDIDIGALISSVELKSDVVGTLDIPDSNLGDKDIFITITNSDAATIDELTENVGTAIFDNTLTAEYVIATNAEIDEAIDNAPPSIDDYDVSNLRAILVTRFPFSIPWDIAAGLTALNAEAIAPSWTFQPFEGVTILPDEVQEVEISLDLSDDMWEPLFTVLRWGLLACYCAALVAATKNLIWG